MATTNNHTIIDQDVLRSAAFRVGQLGRSLDDMTPQEVRDFHGPDLCRIYDDLPEHVRAELSLNNFVASTEDPEKYAKVLAQEDKHSNYTTRELMDGNLRKIDKAVTGPALALLKDLPELGKELTPADISGLIEAATWNSSGSAAALSTKLDPWEYCKYGRLKQSYQTCESQALLSTRTVKDLTGDTVHFMMFQKGGTSIECRRFSFGTSQLDSDAHAVGDRQEIEPNFLALLGLDTSSNLNLPAQLKAHARRLDKVQHILGKKGYWIEQHAQILFQHIVGNLLADIHSTGGVGNPCRVIDVTGMDDMVVIVEVCKEYLESQGKTQGQGMHQLKIRSDLVVQSFVDGSPQPLTGEELRTSALRCKYIIEMKKSNDKLRNSSVKEKSQIIAESLARHLTLRMQGDNDPNVLFSVLADCCCLHVLVHFRAEKRMYLSRREVEPGRMIAVLFWLHTVSHKTDFTEEAFKASGFPIGDTFENELSAVVAHKKRNRDGNTEKSRSQKVKSGSATRGGSNNDNVLDVTAGEESEQKEGERRELATFSAFQNHYLWGCDLPMTHGVLRVLASKHQGENTEVRTNFDESIQRMLRYSVDDGDVEE